MLSETVTSSKLFDMLSLKMIPCLSNIYIIYIIFFFIANYFCAIYIIPKAAKFNYL